MRLVCASGKECEETLAELKCTEATMTDLKLIRVGNDHQSFTLTLEMIRGMEMDMGDPDDDEINTAMEHAVGIMQRYQRLDQTKASGLGDRYHVVKVFTNNVCVTSLESGPDYYQSDVGANVQFRLIRAPSPPTLYFTAYPHTFVAYNSVVVVLFNGETDEDGDEMSIVMSRHHVPNSSITFHRKPPGGSLPSDSFPTLNLDS